jgi:type I restriction-modification system DNA methylase subunit
MMTIVLSHGVLFREVKKVSIRRTYQNNKIDSIIGLPQYFFGTGFQQLLLLKQSRDKDDILIIAASKYLPRGKYKLRAWHQKIEILLQRNSITKYSKHIP